VVPQVAILGGCAQLFWLTQKSRLALYTLLLPFLLVLLVTGKTVYYYGSAFTSAEPGATYGLAIVLLCSWMLQVILIGVAAGSLAMAQVKQLEDVSRRVGQIAFGLIALPPVTFGVLMVVESVIR